MNIQQKIWSEGFCVRPPDGFSLDVTISVIFTTIFCLRKTFNAPAETKCLNLKLQHVTIYLKSSIYHEFCEEGELNISMFYCELGATCGVVLFQKHEDWAHEIWAGCSNRSEEATTASVRSVRPPPGRFAHHFSSDQQNQTWHQRWITSFQNSFSKNSALTS